MNHTKEVEKYNQREIARAIGNLTFIHENRETLEVLNLNFNMWAGHVDFDNLDRPDLLRVLKAFPGTWEKTINFSHTGINYTRKQLVTRFIMRCYNGLPPPSCKIEEITEFVLVPERYEKVVTRKIVCPEVQAQSEPEL